MHELIQFSDETQAKREALYINQLGKYKFYLSFENALCRDYITEKFYLALHAGTLPIVYGGGSKVDYLKVWIFKLFSSFLPLFLDLFCLIALPKLSLVVFCLAVKAVPWRATQKRKACSKFLPIFIIGILYF